MLRNYVLTALRNLQRQPGYAAINILGLALSLACCLLIALFVIDELVHDRQHPDVERLFRLTSHTTASDGVMHFAVTPAVYAPTAAAVIPEIEAFVRIHPAMEQVLFRRGGTRDFEEGVLYVDPSFLQLFGFPLGRGDVATALTEPFTAVLSPALAEKYFGDEDPLGRTLRVDNAYVYTVTGVLAENPQRSHLEFDVLFSMRTLESLAGVRFYGADGLFFRSFHLGATYTYLRIAEGADAATVGDKVTEVIQSHLPPQGPQYALELQPVRDIYLRSDVQYELASLGNIVYVWVFVAVALFMLVIAGINYTNLATARSLRRALEVGVRKALGAGRPELRRQFLAESIVTVTAALGIALLLAGAAIPLFNSITGKELAAAAVFEPNLLAAAIGATLLVGMLAGSYPALLLSSLPALSMMGRSRVSSRGGSGLRRALVVTQFAATVVLLVGTATVYQQLAFFESMDIGFDREELIHLRVPDREVMGRVDAFKELLADHASVMSVGASSSIPGIPTWRHDTRPEGRPADERWLMAFYAVDYDFIETLGLDVLEGRSFSRAVASDSMEAYILNEAALARLGWQGDAVGKEFGWFTEGGLRQGRVIGVVRDFHFESMRSTVDPTFFAIAPEHADRVAVRVRPNRRSEAIAHLEGVWQDFLPAYPFGYEFLDQTLGATYGGERRLAQVVALFTLLTMLVACMGLVGLAAFTAQQRTREVGVRRVLGASTTTLVALLSKDFLKLVGLSFVIAVPLAYVTMDRWLEGFAYRIHLGPAVFIAAGAAALVLALLAVSGQALRAALADPVVAIRTD